MENSKHFLYPSALLVSVKPARIITILGSCVAVCIYDPVLKIGGMNHYMLPYWNGKGLASPKFGNIAIKKLIDEMIIKGSKKYNFIAKVFGGGNITQVSNQIYNINERNIEVAKDILKEFDIPIISSSLGGYQGRKIEFNTETGKVLHKFILRGHQELILY